MKKERLQWIDNMRGLSVVLVILSHTPDTNILQMTLLSLFMIPSFFFISGYLTKYDGSDISSFFYNRVVKLLLVYIAYVFILPFISVTEFLKVVHNPSLVIEKIINSGKYLVLGKSMWFFPCLIIVNLVFMITRKISKTDTVLLIISIIVSCVGYVASYKIGGHRCPWSADKALVCQFYFTLGYILRNKERSEWYNNVFLKAIISGSVYVTSVVVIGYLFDFSLISINVAKGIWGKLWLTIPLTLLSLYSGLYSTRLFKNLKLFPYFGQNSLLYFAIGSHGMSVMNKLFGLMYKKTGFAILANRAIINPIIAFLAAVILIPACWIVNKYAPFFNARYNLPAIKKQFQN